MVEFWISAKSKFLPAHTALPFKKASDLHMLDYEVVLQNYIGKYVE